MLFLPILPDNDTVRDKVKELLRLYRGTTLYGVIGMLRDEKLAEGDVYEAFIRNKRYRENLRD